MMGIAAVAIFASSADARVPGTMNFDNVTGSSVNQTVAETAQNEKEVDYGDFDNDGDLDVLIANALSDFGQRRNKLYRNDGGVFNEVSGNPVIAGFSGTDVSRNGFFRDYDGDGWLDIVIINDRNTGGEGGRNKIFIGQTSGGNFVNYVDGGTARMGTAGGAACGAVSEDFDHDGDYDIYIGNYPNNSQDAYQLNNNNTGFFTTQGINVMVPSDNAYTVDVATGDMNGDGNLDVVIASWNPNHIYYNDMNPTSSGPGDFAYTNSVQSMGSAAGGPQSENIMEPGDFDNDGDLDLYRGNISGTGGVDDRIQVNVGNNAVGWAQFTFNDNLPSYVQSNDTRKATVVDLNEDGRVDIFVMQQNGRPAILRNTTVNGVISFIEWTPGNTFPASTTHRGWHSAAFDANGDGWKDIFLGGWTNDHHFVASDSNEVTDASSTLPALYNLDPVAVVGSTNAEDEFIAPGIASVGNISVVLNSASDFELSLESNLGNPIGSSDRGGLGVEEALELGAPGGNVSIIATLLQAAGDADNDGDIDGVDYSDFLDCESAPGSALQAGCEPFDFDQDGDSDFADFQMFQQNFTGTGGVASGNYVLEVLARN
jgi:hypothetical protein